MFYLRFKMQAQNKYFLPLFSPNLPLRVDGAAALLLFCLIMYLQGRQTEWINRLSFLWRDQVGSMTSRVYDVVGLVLRVVCVLVDGGTHCSERVSTPNTTDRPQLTSDSHRSQLRRLHRIQTTPGKRNNLLINMSSSF